MHDSFVFAAATEIVDPGQIHHIPGAAIPTRADCAPLQINRETRPIGDMGIAPRQSVEQGGLTGVGQAHQGHTDGAGVGWG